MAGEVSRKAVLAGAGVGFVAVAVAACSSGSPPADSTSAEASEPEPLAPTADVPVGAGIIVGEVVLTQPVAGQFNGFSAVCTHSGCLINDVSAGTINCPCHGSKFSLDGAVVNGPAAKPLEPVAVRVQGDSLVTG